MLAKEREGGSAPGEDVKEGVSRVVQRGYIYKWSLAGRRRSSVWSWRARVWKESGTEEARA